MKLKLKEFRQSKGLFQSQMAEILGLNQSNVSRAELKGYISLTYPQQQHLYERFGQEEVDAFAYDNGISVDASNNTNQGRGIQNNGFFASDGTSIEIIRNISDALARLTEKQTEQTDRLLTLLEKLSEKL